MPFLSKIGVPCILSDYEINRYGFDNYQQSELTTMQKQTIEALLVGQDAPSRQCMKPEFIRLAPPLHIADDEVINCTYCANSQNFNILLISSYGSIQMNMCMN
jgi:hypothetical protein